MTGFILNLILIGGCWFAKYYLHILPLLEFVCFPLNLFLYSIIIAMLFRYACTLESQDSLSKRFMMYLGNYSFGLFLIHIIYMYVGSELLTLLHMSPQGDYFRFLMRADLEHSDFLLFAHKPYLRFQNWDGIVHEIFLNCKPFLLKILAEAAPWLLTISP